MSRRSDEFRIPSWPPGLFNYEGKKRHRRTAGEIVRHYRCPFSGCFKSYGLVSFLYNSSEGSLSQHIKLKHKYAPSNVSNIANSVASVEKQSVNSEQAQESIKSERNPSLL